MVGGRKQQKNKAENKERGKIIVRTGRMGTPENKEMAIAGNQKRAGNEKIKIKKEDGLKKNCKH